MDVTHRGGTKVDGWQEGQLGSLQHRFVHLHGESSVQQVGILLQSLLDECLQLRVREHRPPRQIAKRGCILRGNSQRVDIGLDIADDTLCVYAGALVLIIYATTAKQHGCSSKNQNLLHSSFTSLIHSLQDDVHTGISQKPRQGSPLRPRTSWARCAPASSGRAQTASEQP